MSKTILVTGGAGFIGSHLIEALLQRGDRVICLDNFDEFYDPALKRKNIAGMLQNKQFVLAEGDIRDRQLLDELFRSYSIDVVVHLAARAGVRPSIQFPELYYDVNVRGTLTVLEAMKNAGVRKMVFASSSSVYGNNSKVPFSESDSVDNPISPYAATKKACELLCYNYHHLYRFDIFCLRFFTVYGPRQRPEMAIHQFVRHVMQGNEITLFGDGSSRRDYTNIHDILSGILLAEDHLTGYGVFNLGEHTTISLIDLVRTIEKHTGIPAKMKYLPSQPGDVEITYADITKASTMLGYAPSVTVDDGIRKFVEWYKGNV